MRGTVWVTRGTGRPRILVVPIPGPEMTQRLKLVTVGDGGVGKSCMFISFCKNYFPHDYVPTVFDNYVETIEANGKMYEVAMFDTAGQEDYDRLRPLSYPQTDIFLLCFSIESRDSFENTYEKWIHELRHHCPTVPVLLVGCKSDLRSTSPSSKDFVTQAEAQKLAADWGTKYVETSALTQEGLKYCFDNAVQLAMAYTGSPKKKGGFLSKKFGKKEAPVILPPVMPPAGKAPKLEIQTSTFADQWKKALEEPSHADVVFIVEGSHRIQAHKVVLCGASQFFCRVFGIHDTSEKNQLKALDPIKHFTREDLNSGRVRGIASVMDEKAMDCGIDTTQTIVELSADIEGKIFSHVLQFLYTGLPGEDLETSILDKIREASDIFDLPQLRTICDNIETDSDFLNPSIGTYLNDEVGQKMKKLFLNKPLLADIVFKVEGARIYGHKVVLGARCDVMAAMFGGHFAEGQSTTVQEVEIPEATSENFLALLEYLYTDHAPIEEGDSVGILILADQYCQSRLINMCEFYITKEVDQACTKQIEKSEIDVIGLLLLSQTHNAAQLDNWCKHFISTNFDAFTKRDEFELLEGDNLHYLEEHRWPPLDYLNELKEYEQKVLKASGGSKDACAIM